MASKRSRDIGDTGEGPRRSKRFNNPESVRDSKKPGHKGKAKEKGDSKEQTAGTSGRLRRSQRHQPMSDIEQIAQHDDPVHALQSQHDVLRQALQELEKRRSPDPKLEVTTQAGTSQDHSKLTQPPEAHQSIVGKAESISKMLSSDNPNRTSLTTKQIEEMVALLRFVSAERDKGFRRKQESAESSDPRDNKSTEEESKIIDLIDQRFSQWVNFMKGEEKQLPTIDKKLADYLNEHEKRKEIERTAHQDTDIENPERRVLDIKTIRVSLASFVNVRDSKGRYLVLANQNRWNQGDLVFTPIGGALEVKNAGRQFIKSELGVDRLENDDSGKDENDLRFSMEGKKANILLNWFLSRNEEGREISPNREIIEELGEEMRDLTKQFCVNTEQLEDKDFEGLTTKHTGYHFETQPSYKQGQKGALTLRLLEVHDLTGPKQLIDKLIKIGEESTQKNGPLRFVTTQEINRAGHIVVGDRAGEVASVTKALLNPQETLEEFV